MSRVIEILQLISEILDKDNATNDSNTSDKEEKQESGGYQLPLRYQGGKEGK